MNSEYRDHQGRRLVAVTGIGHVSCLGLNMADAWAKVAKGESGIEQITKFDVSEANVKIAGEVKGLNVDQFLPAKLVREMDPFSVFGLVAAEEALRQAGLISASQEETSQLAQIQLDGDIDPTRFGVSIGSCMSGVTTIEENVLKLQNSKRVEARTHPKYLGNMPAGQVSIRYNLRGPNWAVSTACATANHNIGMAARAIQWGEADLMLAGGTDEGVTPFSMAGYIAANALSKRNDVPAEASRPWDVDRDGFVLSEGAGVLLLESLEHAVNRGAPILAVIAGFGSGSDAEHVTKPPKNGHGGAAAQRMALKDADITTAKLNYINAHGTSTPLGDFAELQGIASVLEADGTPKSQVPVSSTKSLHGHALGAAGGIEAGICIQAMQESLIPATANLYTADRGCDGFDLVPREAKPAELNYVLSNSYGFGGTTSALIFAHPRMYGIK